MNNFLWIGSIGLVAGFLVNLVGLLFFKENAAFFTVAWWSNWFPAYVVWIVFLFIGVGHKFCGKANKDVSE
jgi:hypothetical protein